MGGPAHHVSLLGGLLDADRYDTLLLHGAVGRGEESLAEVAERYGARTKAVPGLRPEVRPADDVLAFAALVREIRAFKPDIVDTHMAKAGMLGRLAAFLGTRRRAAIVHTYHGHVLEGYFGRVRNGLYRGMEMALGKMSDRLIGVSRATVDDLARLRSAPRSKFSVIPYGLDLSAFLRLVPEDGLQFRSEVGVGPDEVLLTFVGRLVPIKRVDVLLRAVARARTAGAAVRLAIVGDGDCRASLEQLVSELSLGASVNFLGYRADVLQVAAGADIAVLSSDNEGTPFSLIEAAAGGHPAVATDVGGVAEVVLPDTGLLAPARDDAALGDAIARLALDPDLRRRMGARAREHVARQYSLERLLNDMDRLYQELMDNKLTHRPRTRRS